MIRENIRQSPEYQAIVAQQAGEATNGQAGTTNTAIGAVKPVVSLEKSDVEFWLQVLQLIVLWMILMELRRGG
jgi:hypothetical protein